jgi:hypothetical protein
LNTFEPTTTPTPIFEWLATRAATAVAISGASAPSAVRMPWRPSETSSRALSRSSPRAKTTVAASVPRRLTQKTGMASPVDRRYCS